MRICEEYAQKAENIERLDCHFYSANFNSNCEKYFKQESHRVPMCGTWSEAFRT